MNFPFLTPEELKECQRVAKARFKEQEHDHFSSGERIAGYSYGKRQFWDARNAQKRLEDHLMGAVGEQQSAKRLNCVWTKEHGQYKDNKSPDLFPLFNGQKIRAEARMTRHRNKFLVREVDLTKNEGILSCCNTYIGWIGWIEFSKLSILIKEGKGERVNAPGKPAWWISNEYLCKDMSLFG